MLSSDEQYLIREWADTHCTYHHRDRKFQAMLLRSARDENERRYIMQAIMYARRNWLSWLTRTQREWQTKISRRPQRTRHHDSWALRESYVRGGSYGDYLPTPGAPQR